jgi:iron complex outermembrane receptor protein
MNKWHFLSTSAAIYLLAGAGTAACAEDQQPGLSSAAPVQALEEIVVTAQKRYESLEDVPISVTAVSGTELSRHNIYDPSQLQFVAPTLQMTSYNGAIGATNFSIRGVGTLTFSPALDASVSTVIDGVVMGRPELGVMNFSDIRQVEVLNGPQGMLFGKNASAGLVNIQTVQPVLGRYEVLAHGSFGAMSTPGQEGIGQVTLNAPIGEDAALRLNGFYTSHGPLVRDAYPDPGSNLRQVESGIKLKYRWEPVGPLSINLGVDYTSSNGAGPGVQTDRSLGAGSPFASLDGALGIKPGPMNAYMSSDAPTNTHFEVGGAQATADYWFSNGIVLTDIAAWRAFHNAENFDADSHQLNFIDTVRIRQNFGQATNELRFTSPGGGTLDYQGGLYYYYSRVENSQYISGNLGGPPPPAPLVGVLGVADNNVQINTSYAAFGQATWHVTDRARLTFGARETYDDLSVTGHFDPGGNEIGFGGPGSSNFFQARNQANFSWRAIGQYDLTSNMMGYVSYAKGYKGPGFNVGFTTTNPSVGPEFPTDIEGGLKIRLLDHRLNLNVSAFTESFDQFQSAGLDVAHDTYIVINAGQLKSRGFEVELNSAPLPGFTVNGGVSYAHAYFSSFTVDQCYVGQVSCLNGTSNSTGHNLPNAPRWTFNIDSGYEHVISPALKVILDAGVYYRDTVNYSSNADPHTIQPGFYLLDGSIGLGAQDGRWKVSVFCRNCADRRFATYIAANVASPADYGQTFGVNSFRTVGVSLDGRF